MEEHLKLNSAKRGSLPWLCKRSIRNQQRAALSEKSDKQSSNGAVVVGKQGCRLLHKGLSSTPKKLFCSATRTPSNKGAASSNQQFYQKELK